jgi:superfamily II DNA or RNA helicase
MKDVGKSYFDASAQTAVAGVDTLIRRATELKAWSSAVSLWVTDEAHHVLSPEINKWGKAVEMFPNAKGLGVTASPRRADGKGLGASTDGVFDVMIEGITMRELIDLGYLVDYRVFAPPSDLDLSSVAVSKTTGDYNHDQIVKAVRKSHIVGDVVDHYLRIAKGKRGITFATDVQTAHDISDQFNQAGVPSKAISADTSDTERYEAVQDLASGKLLQLVNVDLFGEGVDVPAVEVVSFARPTESLSLHVQQAGRALRLLLPRSDHAVWESLSPEERKARIARSEKPHAIIIDHVGNITRHGLPDARRIWSLDRRDSKKRSKDDNVIPVRACHECTMVYERIYKACPFCGFEPIPTARSLPEQVDGDLMELDAETLARMRGDVDRANMSIEDKQLELAQKHVPYAGQLYQVKLHRSRLEMLSALKDTMAVWGGIQTSQGRSDSEIQRLFYFKFGIDVLSAQGLPTKEAEELLIRIALEVNR